MTYKRSLLAIVVLLALITTGYMVAVRPGAAERKKISNRKGPRVLPPAVKSEVEGLVIANVRFARGDEMTVYDIFNNTDKAVLSVVVRAADASLTADADPGAILIPPGGRHVGEMPTDNIKDDTPLVLSAATFEGDEVKGTPRDVRRMNEYRRERRDRVRSEKESGSGQ
jgi:hypothetical protein